MILYKDAVQEASSLLAEKNIENAALDAFYLFSYVTGLNRASYLCHQEEEMTEEKYQIYSSLVKKRAQHIPLQYLTGEQEFMGLNFKVTPDVLIPRQDTEILVEEVKKTCKGKKVLDVCTGSGCIAISIFRLYEPASVAALDLSEKALLVAKENAANLNADVTFIQSNMFEKVEMTYDIIVSNPPYIKSSEVLELMPEVREHEPRMALDGEEDGLKFYRILAKEAKDYLNSDGWLYLEIGCDQAKEVSMLLMENGYDNIKVTKDYAGLDRVVSAHRI